MTNTSNLFQRIALGCMLLIAMWISGCGTTENSRASVTASTPIALNATAPATTDPDPDATSTSVTIAVQKTEIAGEGISETQPATATGVELVENPPIWYRYKVVAEYPHDANAFTQGLLFDQGVLYEGTGLYGESTLRRVDLASGAAEQMITLPDTYFGEGIAIVGNKIYQLTWRENIGFIYDKSSFEKLGEFTYATEGWGLTYDGRHLIMSDGTERLFFLDPTTMAVVEEQRVTMIDPVDQTRKAVVRLNELEYINDEIFANIWQTDIIVRIDPLSGTVQGVIDLSGILAPEDRNATTDVLNGIAYLSQENRLFVTGKKWPKLFEIKLIPQQ